VGEGTGLGMWVVHGIVKSHGGAIAVESELGRGTSVTVYFPAAETPQPVPDPPAATQSVTPLPTAMAGRVLFVDDGRALVFLAERALDRLGYRVAGYSDPILALAEFRSRPDELKVVVTDSAMPGLSGPDLVRELRRIRPGVPVIMISGYLHPEDVQAAEKLGISDLVLKPTAGSSSEDPRSSSAGARGRVKILVLFGRGPSRPQR